MNKVFIGRWGWRGYLMSAGWSRLSRAGLHVHRVLLRTIGPRCQTGLPAGYRISIDGGKALQECSQQELSHLDLSEVFLAGANERGDQCIGLYERERLVAYVWNSRGLVPVSPGVGVIVGRQSFVYGYKIFVRADRRGAGLGQLLLAYQNDICRERGIKGVVSYVAIQNYAAHRHSAKFGRVQRVGIAGYFEGMQRVTPFRSLGARDVGFQFLGIDRAGNATSLSNNSTSPL